MSIFLGSVRITFLEPCSSFREDKKSHRGNSKGGGSGSNNSVSGGSVKSAPASAEEHRRRSQAGKSRRWSNKMALPPKPGSSRARSSKVTPDTDVDAAAAAAALNVANQGYIEVVDGKMRLVFDVEEKLFKIQVKAAWFDQNKGNYEVDNRRTKTNRRQMIRENYVCNDFDFAVLYIEELDVCYIMPVDIFISYGSEIHLVEDDKRQRKPRSAEYREAWHLLD